ncbi:MAG: hypothetical protein WC140_01860 [Bacteroidales bacterium]
MPFIKEILKYKSLSIVGLEKNVGKTECLNYILNRLPFNKRGVCITSIGVDGEKMDQVTATEKPEIHIREGLYFVTSEKHYRSREVISELIDITDENTSLGRILTARAVAPGKVMLSGPASTASLARIMKKNRYLGIDLNIIDGALSRLSSASPVISEAMVLATGAAYSANIKTLVNKTAFVCEMINLPLATKSENNNVMMVSSLFSNNVKIDDNVDVVYINGALTDRFMKKFMSEKRLSEIELRVKDFTKIFIEPQTYHYFIKRGGHLTCEQKSKLLAVTVNPTAPNGYNLDSDMLCKTLSEAIGLPVYDIVKNKYEV